MTLNYLKGKHEIEMDKNTQKNGYEMRGLK